MNKSLIMLSLQFMNEAIQLSMERGIWMMQALGAGARLE